MNTTSFEQSDFLNEIDENVIKVKSYKSVYTRRIVGRGEKKTIQIRLHSLTLLSVLLLYCFKKKTIQIRLHSLILLSVLFPYCFKKKNK